MQSEEGKSFIAGSGIDTVNLNSVLFFSSGKFYIKSSAVLHLFKELGGIWGLLFGFIVVPPFIRDFFYDLIARYRYKLFGMRNTCMVPDQFSGED